jgi:hypothetical protein
MEETSLHELITSYNKYNSAIAKAKEDNNKNLVDLEEEKKLGVLKKIKYIHEICDSVYAHMKKSYWTSRTPKYPNSKLILQNMSELINNRTNDDLEYLKIEYTPSLNAHLNNFNLELTKEHELKDNISCFPVALIDYIVNTLKPSEGIVLMKCKKIVRKSIYSSKEQKFPNGIYDVIAMHCTYENKKGKSTTYFDIVEDPNTKLYLNEVTSYEITCK